MFDIQEELKKLPQQPGVYLMKNKHEQIIYVGKAINLRNRVRSYFQQSSQEYYKLKQMVPQIKSFEYIVTDSEIEALILEANLIKANEPKYNVRLKDDKSYPYIKLTSNEAYPRLFSTRQNDRDKAKYYGPYSSMMMVSENLELIHTIWPLRRCTKKIESENGNDRPCLNYHILNCKAPCAGLINREEYGKIINEALDFLNGRHDDVLKKLEVKMQKYSEELEFEKAAETRDTIRAVKSLREKQKVDLGTGDQDIIAFAKKVDEALVQVFFIRNGKMLGREHFMLNGVAEMTPEEIMTAFITQFYGGTPFIPKELILDIDINDREVITEWLSREKGQRVVISVPKKGEKRNLVDLAVQNAKFAIDQFGEQMKRDRERTEGALKEITDALGIGININRIEAYDVSNIQGFESVGSMVVFEEGKPKRSDYRKFKIKGVVGANDCASIEEVLTRRIKRYLDEDETSSAKFGKKPDIIFIDGGAAQTAAAERVLSILKVNIPVCGMVKDDRHRTRGLWYKEREITLPVSKEGFKLLTRIQDEVHRFAVEYHRKLREKSQVRSLLDEIKGIGPARRKALMKHFGDISKIRTATVDELLKAENMNIKSAQEVYKFFHTD